jgi:hypothetical protein
VKVYEVTIMVDGRSWGEVISATSAGDAIAAVKRMWPTAAIFGAQVIG